MEIQLLEGMINGGEGNITWFPERQELLCRLIKETKPKTLIETGFNMGHSALLICNTIKELKDSDIEYREAKVNFYIFDICEHECVKPNFNILKENFKDIINLHFIEGSTFDTLKDFNTIDNQLIDFAEIDGCHTYEGVQNDVKCVLEKISVGGIIYIDDYKSSKFNIDGVNRGVDDLDWSKFSPNYTDGVFWVKNLGAQVIQEKKQTNILHELVEKYGTDKNLSGYTNTYFNLFDSIKEGITSVLEIGLGTLDPTVPSSFAGNTRLYQHYKQGGSLRVWRDYFKNAQIYGVDIAKDCMFSEDRIKTFLFDSAEQNYVEYYLEGLTFDIIIDDGNHDPKYQIKTLKNLFPKLREGGYYVIEDVGGYGGSEQLMVDYLKELLNILGEYTFTNHGNHLVIKKVKQVVFKNKSLKNYTIVTGLWNIGRNGRDFEEHYLPNFERFLQIDAPMVVFIPSSLKKFVEDRRSSVNTKIAVYELEDVKRLYGPFWEKTQEIRTNPNWYNLTGEQGWLKSSPQASLEWYNPIVQSKMFMLHDASVWNPFNTEYFYWLDAGITNTVPSDHLVENNVFDKITKLTDPFLFLSYPYITNSEIHGFEINAMNRFAGAQVEYVCRGGLFGGQKHILSEANGTYYSLLNKTINEGYMGTEESIFTLMSYLDPLKYRRYALDGNGLIVKFTNEVLNDSAILESSPGGRVYIKPKDTDISKLKTSLYMLTFNFPQQVRYTLEKYKEHPGFLTNTRKILIDNSNNDEAIAGNKQICEEYGFEHIITGENLGINRGRHRAAEHFDQSDSDFYIFLEDDMGIYSPNNTGFCRNGFRKFVPDLYNKVHKIMLKEEFDFLKLTFTEVYMDNHLQVSWYNVPQTVRTAVWPHYDKLPIQGLDENCPRTKFNKIDVLEELAYIDGEIYYANWPMIVGKEGNRKMFLNTTWAAPYEQTWMSFMFQETMAGRLRPAVLLASPIEHNRIVYYKPEERREN
jgi:predicted O-methyltransferase YrrM